MEIVPFRPSEVTYRHRVALLKEAQPEEPWSLEGEVAADAADAAAGGPICAFFAVAKSALGTGTSSASPGPRPTPMCPLPGGAACGWWWPTPPGAGAWGTALLDAVGEAAAASGATEFHVSTSLAEPDGLAFALARGFREVEAEHELHLDLDAFEPGGSRRACPGPGIVTAWRRCSAAIPGWFERYYRLHTAVEASAPWGLGYAVPSREAFRRRHVDAGEALPEGTTIAVADGEWVGLCEMWRSGDDTHTAYEELTGVLPAYRGQGLGTALVAAAAAWAKDRGYHRLLTSTSTSNEAMQRTARRLGFVVAGRWIHLLGPAARRGVPSGPEVGP